MDHSTDDLNEPQNERCGPGHMLIRLIKKQQYVFKVPSHSHAQLEQESFSFNAFDILHFN